MTSNNEYKEYIDYLIKGLCYLTEYPDDPNKLITSYYNSHNNFINFVDGFQERFNKYSNTSYPSLNDLIYIYYNDEIPEGKDYCDGYGMLTDFIDSMNINDCKAINVDKLDEITWDDVFYDEEESYENDDKEIINDAQSNNTPNKTNKSKNRIERDL